MSVRAAMLALVALLAIGGIATGCGDDGATTASGTTSEGVKPGSSPGSGDGGAQMSLETSSLSREEFVERASKACGEEREGLLTEVSKYMKREGLKELSEPPQIASMVKAVLVPTIEAETEAIRELGAPEGDEAEVEAILKAQEEGIEEVKELNRAESLEDVEDHFQTATKLLRAYGFKACTNG